MLIMCKHPISQRGVILLESLIAILLFSIGILALVAMYANSMTIATDAKYRMEAANHANQILSRMWAQVDRSSPAAFTASLAGFAYNPAGANCDFTGGGDNATVLAWLEEIQNGPARLPGADAESVQIQVDTGAFNQVLI